MVKKHSKESGESGESVKGGGRAPSSTKDAPSGTMAIDKSLFAPEDTEGYYDGMDSGAYSRPFLGILQALSPAVNRGKPEYIEGATAGLLFNSVTKEYFDSALVTVLRRSHTITYWIPREAGGGFLREEDVHLENFAAMMALPLDDKKRRLTKEQVNGKETVVEVVECRNFWCCLFGKTMEDSQIALVSMAKSQLSCARDWNSLINVRSTRLKDEATGKIIPNLPPVLQSGVWKLSTVLKTKGENNWHKWKIEFVTLHKDAAIVEDVRSKVLLAREQISVDRQLEQMADSEEEATTGEM